MKVHLLSILLLLLSSSAFAARQTFFYNRLQSLPLDSLLRQAHRYSVIEDHQDSALACLTIACNKYSADMNDTDKRRCIEAFIGKWYVLFFHYYDYARAYESLSKAEDIARNEHDLLPNIWLSFGCMFQALAEQGKEQKHYHLALNYYRKCLRAYTDKGCDNADMAFANIVALSFTTHQMKGLTEDYNHYRRLKTAKGNLVKQYNILLYKGYNALWRKDYAKAMASFQSQLSLLPDRPFFSRYRMGTLLLMARTDAMRGNIDNALERLDKIVETAERQNMKDARLEAYALQEQYYGRMGDRRKSLDCRSKYLELKDSLLNYHQVQTVNDIHFLNEMRKVDEKMLKERHDKQLMNIAVGVAGLVIVIVCTFLAMLYRNYRKLKESHRQLYLKTVGLLKMEDKERLTREERKDEKKEQKTSRYNGSKISEQDKQHLLAHIQEAMENSTEIFSPAFTVNKLAQMVDSNEKYVSQVINEKTGGNFPSFLNEYRIKEACRRMEDKEHYGNVTIETIGNEVGYKSRSAFISAFKRFTGLTPSQYLKFATMSSAENNSREE